MKTRLAAFFGRLRARAVRISTGGRDLLTRDPVILFFLVVPVLAVAGVLAYESMTASATDGACIRRTDLRAVAHWFDPAFLQYTLLLAATAILIVPLIPYSYVSNMMVRKRVRLRSEMPDAVWAAKRATILARLDHRARFRFYAGSAGLAAIVVALGVSILLLFKPVWDPALCGAMLSKGANILIAGPDIVGFGYPNPDKLLYEHLVLHLVAFQFGFLGAYIYFLTSLSRAYFTLDLTPETFIDGAIRIAVASVFALVLSFGLEDATKALAPVIGFFFGFFPKRALLVLEKMVLAVVKQVSTTSYDDVPLASLPGMSYAHEVRLEREGFDNAQNLSFADPTDLAIRTGFSYGQLCAWIDDAWLATRLREDYQAFAKLTGVTSRTELEHLLNGITVAQARDLLVSVDPAMPNNAALRRKLEVVLSLL